MTASTMNHVEADYLGSFRMPGTTRTAHVGLTSHYVGLAWMMHRWKCIKNNKKAVSVWNSRTTWYIFKRKCLVKCLNVMDLGLQNFETRLMTIFQRFWLFCKLTLKKFLGSIFFSCGNKRINRERLPRRRLHKYIKIGMIFQSAQGWITEILWQTCHIQNIKYDLVSEPCIVWSWC